MYFWRTYSVQYTILYTLAIAFLHKFFAIVKENVIYFNKGILRNFFLKNFIITKIYDNRKKRRQDRKPTNLYFCTVNTCTLKYHKIEVDY